MDAAAADLFAVTGAWTRQWWDPVESMVWNPPGSFGEPLAARTVHLTPNTAWFAFAALASDDDGERADGRAALRRLVDLQYDAEGEPWDGTFPRFLEAPHPRPGARIWDHYDPNWRQFVGTTFALILEDELLADTGPDRSLATDLDAAIGRCVAGEPDGRIPVGYTNPALMRAWLDGWYGRRQGDDHLVRRGERFGGEIVERFDRHGGFDEFNSPTYYGIDLLALRLWQEFPPTPMFAAEGARLEAWVWHSAADFFNPHLGTFGGPFTRSYDPDARKAVTLMSLWVWADRGRAVAPLPDLDADVVEHGHDLMAGPLIARLASPATRFQPSAAEDRRVEATVADRTINAEVHTHYSLGVESSPHDWGGWDQFMPLVLHWRDGTTIECCWLAGPGVVEARVLPDAAPTGVTVELRTSTPVILRTRTTATLGTAGRLALGAAASLTATSAGTELTWLVESDRDDVVRVELVGAGPDDWVRLEVEISEPGRLGKTSRP